MVKVHPIHNQSISNDHISYFQSNGLSGFRNSSNLYVLLESAWYGAQFYWISGISFCMLTCIRELVSDIFVDHDKASIF